MDDQNSYFECPICGEVFTDVVETPCCHKCYCKECLKIWIKKSSNCPECRQNISLDAELRPNHPIQRMVDSLPSSCTYKEKGCKDSVTRGTMKQHAEKCMFREMNCPNEKCKILIMKKDLDQHLKQTCNFRTIDCPICSVQISMNELDAHKRDTCPEMEIKCHCESRVKRKDMEEHISKVCSELIIQCKYKSCGCNKTFRRSETIIHEKENKKFHLQLAFDSFNNIGGRLKEANDELEFTKKELERVYNSIHYAKKDLTYSLLNRFPCLLPSFLVNVHESAIVGVENERTTYYRKTIFGLNKAKACLIRGDIPIPEAKYETYYFEMTIDNQGKDCAIGIGLASVKHNFVGMPGWELGYGYHGDDGNKFQGIMRGYGEDYGPGYQRGDVVGMGYDQRTNEVFFTKNGKHLGVAFKDVVGNYYPVVGLHTPEARVRVNFGQESFKYLPMNPPA